MTATATTFFLVDPELYVPGLDDPIFAAAGVTRMMASGSFTVSVDSPAELLRVRTSIEAGLAAQVETYQRAIVPPCYVVREWTAPTGEALTIYGKVYSPREANDHEMSLGGSPGEGAMIEARVIDALARGWLWGQYFSAVEEGGEWGCAHRSQVAHAITADEFETARAEGWPS